jgi:NAD(P)H-dependent FMN reductase
LKLDDQMHYSEIEARNRRTLEAAEELGYQLEASKEEVRRVMDWQWPMYSLDFTEIKVTEDAIQRERDAAYADYV